MEKDKEFANKQLLRKSIELNIVGEIVRLHDMGMDSKTAMDIITQVLWDTGSSITQKVQRDLKNVKGAEMPEYNMSDDMPEFNDDFDDEEDNTNIKNMKGGLIK
jgi:hypothetical protein